ncbi:MAG TPA: hypothetical protein DCY40_03435 [Actinobacteria bacterium]|nr:hypothetical protein [Actinomycetota bacterium]
MPAATTPEPLPDMITIGDKYRPAMEITDQAEADAYFERCVEHSMVRGGLSRKDAEERERQNLGYFCGYYGRETRERVFRLYRCAHPVFGTSTPTVGDAIAAGRRMAGERPS